MGDLEDYIEIRNVNAARHYGYKDIIEWPAENIEDCPRQTVAGYKDSPDPYDFSAISQYARFRGHTGLWKLEIRGQQHKVTVWFKNTVDSKTVVKFALKWAKQ